MQAGRQHRKHTFFVTVSARGVLQVQSMALTVFWQIKLSVNQICQCCMKARQHLQDKSFMLQDAIQKRQREQQADSSCNPQPGHGVGLQQQFSSSAVPSTPTASKRASTSTTSARPIVQIGQPRLGKQHAYIDIGKGCKAAGKTSQAVDAEHARAAATAAHSVQQQLQDADSSKCQTTAAAQQRAQAPRHAAASEAASAAAANHEVVTAADSKAAADSRTGHRDKEGIETPLSSQAQSDASHRFIQHTRPGTLQLGEEGSLKDDSAGTIEQEQPCTPLPLQESLQKQPCTPGLGATSAQCPALGLTADQQQPFASDLEAVLEQPCAVGLGEIQGQPSTSGLGAVQEQPSASGLHAIEQQPTSSAVGNASGLAAEDSIRFRKRSKFEALKARREEARLHAEVSALSQQAVFCHIQRGVQNHSSVLKKTICDGAPARFRLPYLALF